MASTGAPTAATSSLQTLQRLEETLKSLPDKESAPKLSHYRAIPSSLQNAFDLLQQAASSIHANSTKFALMGKIDVSQATEMARDTLLPGCQWICTGALVVHQDSTGCTKSLRHAIKRATRAVLQSTIQLVQCFTGDAAAFTENEQLAAQRTGAVWEACQTILNMQNGQSSSLPISNQLAMRREFSIYIKECNETMQEFQEMIDAGPSLDEGKEHENGDGEADEIDEGEEPSWEQFLGGGTDQYTLQETPIATSALALVKCSRGCINVAMQACDDVGKSLTEDATGNGNELSNVDEARLQWILRLFNCAQAVGEGMTDLGAAMYPPIKRQELECQILRQCAAMEELLACLFDRTLPEYESFDLGRNVSNLATKLQLAVGRRKDEALEAVALGTD
ncbi:hypothetical protein MPSEU_000851900 [Mayamaea pseudoterrestris]|nr:hypothetical protein MPSEU_000851900 [Mayamaea pseudoterrestris]